MTTDKLCDDCHCWNCHGRGEYDAVDDYWDDAGENGSVQTAQRIVAEHGGRMAHCDYCDGYGIVPCGATHHCDYCEQGCGWVTNGICIVCWLDEKYSGIFTTYSNDSVRRKMRALDDPTTGLATIGERLQRRNDHEQRTQETSP